MEALERARHCEHWAVIGGSKQSAAVKDFLELYANQQPLLGPDEVKVYKKGWSTTGDKKLCRVNKQKPLSLWT